MLLLFMIERKEEPYPTKYNRGDNSLSLNERNLSCARIQSLQLLTGVPQMDKVATRIDNVLSHFSCYNFFLVYSN